MATSNSTRPASNLDRFDELWRIFYAQRAVLFGADYIPEGTEGIDLRAGVLVALDRLAADGERLAAEARDKCPPEEPALGV